MVHGKNRIPYRIDWILTGLTVHDYDAIISFGLPFEPEYCQYWKSWVIPLHERRPRVLLAGHGLWIRAHSVFWVGLLTALTATSLLSCDNVPQPGTTTRPAPTHERGSAAAPDTISYASYNIFPRSHGCFDLSPGLHKRPLAGAARPGFGFLDPAANLDTRRHRR